MRVELNNLSRVVWAPQALFPFGPNVKLHGGFSPIAIAKAIGRPEMWPAIIVVRQSQTHHTPPEQEKVS